MRLRLPTLLPLVVCTAASFGQPVRVQTGPISINPAWWTQLGGSSIHSGSTPTSRTSGPYLSQPEWTTIGDGSITLSFTPQAGVVADDLHVYALGFDQGFVHHLAAFDQDTGDLAWATDIPFALLDSWTTPTIDPNNNSIIIATGFSVLALDRFTGDLLWTTNFDQPLVNASPCVTHDLAGTNRVFMTDYSFGSRANGSLTCINVDPKTPTNPFAPGEIVWSIQLPGDCSGNTPAYHDGIVYVSTADDGFGGPGHILAFEAASPTEPAPLWDTPNVESHGFYSAVSYFGGFVYASSYNFSGLQRSANTIKIDAETGSVQWSIPTVRTDASPVILPNGNIIISGGVPTSPTTFFTGSLPAIELIKDLGTSATMLWDSFEATHDDLNENGIWDQGEPYLSLGGWGHHPIVFQNGHNAKLLVATMTPPSGFDPFSHASDLHTIDLSKHPANPGFIISTQSNLGTTPALVGNRVYTTSNIGLSGLTLDHAAQPVPLIELLRAIVDGHTPITKLKPTP